MSQPLHKQTREELKVIAEKAILVGVHLPGGYVDPTDPFSELRALTTTAGAVIVGELLQRRRKPRGRTYLGKGKVDELCNLIKLTGATLVIFDNDLSPAQIRNLEKETCCKIIDRSELILDIFANRAATSEAKLQVEIAQLEYTYPRLRAMWDHLGQIVGGAPVGIGTRGPGEQQLEIDRRIVKRRLALLKRELEEIQGRKSREVGQRNLDHFTVGLVGYTNAGKSTLFNRLSEGGGAYAHDKLFATLSTRVEKWKLGRGNEALLSDTVGFIRNLPHHLVASFRSTLEETIYANMLIIVVDVADHNARMQLETVQQTLDEIGATAQPRIIALNKVDALRKPDEELAAWREMLPEETTVIISAKTGEGTDRLADIALDRMLGGVREVEVVTPLADARTIDFLERRAEVTQRDYRNGDAIFRVLLGRRHIDQLLAQGARMTINGLPALDAAKRDWPNDDAPPPVRVPPHIKAQQNG
ncbi:MAG TPA: GTPase HflX [Phycisphaerales bacterium]|nr:GTPase HflX [Phycisphaerales bacterium]HRQ76573.1 GTPase HflX [Phycisphaerales bacterium]